MPDDFHAYRSNLAPGCSDAQVSEHYDGGDDEVEWGEEESQFMNDTIEAESEPTQSLALRPADPPPAASVRVDREAEIAEVLSVARQKATSLELTQDERDAIMAQFDDADVEIRPHDGLLYIPHIVISDRLCKVFGPGKWCTVRRREWLEGTKIYAEWVMLIRGVFIGESVGAMDYHANNAKMNYSDALEGTRGECIRRIAAKELGCGSQVWRPAFCREWIYKHAAQVKGRWERRLTDYDAEAPKPQPATKSPPKANPAPAKAPLSEDEIRKRFFEFITPYRAKFVDEAIKAGWLLPTEGLEDLDTKYIPKDKAAVEALFKAMGEPVPAPKK